MIRAEFGLQHLENYTETTIFVYAKLLATCFGNVTEPLAPNAKQNTPAKQLDFHDSNKKKKRVTCSYFLFIIVLTAIGVIHEARIAFPLEDQVKL